MEAMQGQGNKAVKSDAEVTTCRVMAEQLQHQQSHSLCSLQRESVAQENRVEMRKCRLLG